MVPPTARLPRAPFVRALCAVVIVTAAAINARAVEPATSGKPSAAPTRNYPVPFPPKIPGGKTIITAETPDFLKPGPNLLPDVDIARTPPSVDFLYYPEQNYPGNPWSHRSDGIVVGDKYYSSSNDHLAPRGTALLWEYDDARRQFKLLCDTTKFLESQQAFPADMNYRPGEMQSRIDLGSDGWLYYATDRGSPGVTHDKNGYRGEWVLRTNPATLETQIVMTHPVEKHTIPASVLDPERLILYCGTAVGKDASNQKIQFFALDVRKKKILKVADDGPTRTLIFSKSTGRVFWEGKQYDPATNEITAANVPHVRSCTVETSQGIVYGTSGTKSDLWAYHVKTDELKQLGDLAVASNHYIASIEVDPTGRYLYYVPGAHGGAVRDGTPVVQYDVATGRRKVLAFLHETFWKACRYGLDGCFGSALDEKGERLFISWDGYREGHPAGKPECAAMTVVRIPASERSLEPPKQSGISPRRSGLGLTNSPEVAANGVSESKPGQRRSNQGRSNQRPGTVIAIPVSHRNDLSGRGLTYDARELFERGVARHLQLAVGGAAITLERGVLVEDDGPAAGFSYQPNEETLADGVQIKKELILPATGAYGATLLLGRTAHKKDEALAVTVNGTPVSLEPAESGSRTWQAFRFEPGVLRAGQNDIVVSGTGKLWIARADEYPAGIHPNRSARSTDGGRTWDYGKLGPRGEIDGEYYVRVVLDQHVERGWLRLPVIDAGNLAGAAIAPHVATPGPVQVKIDAARPAGTQLVARYRTGTTLVPTDSSWTAWQELPRSEPTIAAPRGRYMQLELALASRDPRITPELRSVRIEASPPPIDWSQRIALVEQRNPPLVRSAVPFRYEPFDRAELKTLRETYKLDDVVAGAASEWELITRLAAWSAGRWERMHLAQSYPDWNALEILKAHADGTPVGGFCQHYNLVFLQACESFGLVGRAVSIGPGVQGERISRGGHEVVEIWSNEQAKWIYVDGNCAWYAVDAESQSPLSLLELRERQLLALDNKQHRAIRVVRIAPNKHEWPSLTAWPPFAELRLIPRSDFLAERGPLPLNQGMRGWSWTGHHVWDDEQSPAAAIYGQRVRRQGDWQWTINQAHLALTATDTAGKLQVELDSDTPNFDRYLASIDGAPAEQVEICFTWKLHAGQNRLQVWPVNQLGRAGVASHVVVNSP